MIISENNLDEWVRGNAQKAQGLIVELVYRLVAASCSNPKERRFPLGDSIGQPGPDGILNTDIDFLPFVPNGRSFWEIGTGNNAKNKATSDYKKLTTATPAPVRKESAFIFVTPLSGRRVWSYTWEKDAQANWLEKRQKSNDWRDVRVIDGTCLIDWLNHFPAVEVWFAREMGLPAQQIQTPEQHWNELKTIGAPPYLTPNVFLANREEACIRLKEVFSGTTRQLRIDTHYPSQVADFVAAFIAAMNEESRVDAVGRCLIISGSEAWNAITPLRDVHVLVANFDLNVGGSEETILFERARRGGHTVVFSGPPGGVPDSHRVSMLSPKSHRIQKALEEGGVPDSHRVSMLSPKSHHIQKALEEAGYNPERGRTLAHKSNGNLSSLLRCLQNLSLMPEWTQGTEAAELIIADLLGGWQEDFEADKAVVKNLSKKAYGEWIGKMREIALRPGTPLIQRDGIWKIVARYEGWYGLGPNLFDEHLNGLKDSAISVLREQDPKFELPKEERYAASIHHKVLSHSHLLRNGLAESLALLGSHPKALTSCSSGKAEVTAVLAVREILKEADWVLWASLGRLLPLLAEAAPGEFLDAVENALYSDPCPFDVIFAQEGSDTTTGANYMSGLLWALETLAWDADYLSRVTVVLGELAARDPGGIWANRPANSLSIIFLPWLPQTCAPVAKRQTAVEILFNELPGVAWKLLLSLLPSAHQVSMGSRKPTWREMIPDNWSQGATNEEYWEQITVYVKLAMHAAENDFAKLGDLVERLSNLPPQARDKVIAFLGSDKVLSLSEAERLPLWTKIVDFISRHRKFADAEWAMKPEEVDKIAVIAERMAPDTPICRNQRLFGEREFILYEEGDNYEELRKQLEERRRKAVRDVFAAGGMADILKFAKAVESSWHVGFAFGEIAATDVEYEILPILLESETKPIAQFAGGFVLGRFRLREWQWVDSLDMSQWTPSQKGQLLAYLPFTTENWERSTRLLGEDESPYWSKANVRPYQDISNPEYAIDRLVEYGRPNAAIRCIAWLLHDKRPLNCQQAIRVLQALPRSLEGSNAVDTYDIITVITALQGDPNTNPNDLSQIEFLFLPLLDRHHGAFPTLLEQQLADNPDFFCEVIRAGFRAKKEAKSSDNNAEQQRQIARNAYRLLYNWGTPPGSRKDGTFDGEALSAWLSKVKATCKESGHLDIAFQMIGHVLTHIQPDPDGLWIHHSAARALNAQNAKDMREGFQIALFNHAVFTHGQLVAKNWNWLKSIGSKPKMLRLTVTTAWQVLFEIWQLLMNSPPRERRPKIF
ncbi:MAG: hypothetical protein ABIH04_05100 [Planctomycetota bacterium]